MSKYPGRSITLEVDADDSGGVTYATIAQVRDIAGPSAATSDVDTTSRDSTAQAMEFLGGFKNGGEVTFDIVYDPGLSDHDSLATLYVSRLEVPFILRFPVATAKLKTFRGFIKAFQPRAPLEDRLHANVTIKITKAIVLFSQPDGSGWDSFSEDDWNNFTESQWFNLLG